jgi:hypothetical protein
MPSSYVNKKDNMRKPHKVTPTSVKDYGVKGNNVTHKGVVDSSKPMPSQNKRPGYLAGENSAKVTKQVNKQARVAVQAGGGGSHGSYKVGSPKIATGTGRSANDIGPKRLKANSQAGARAGAKDWATNNLRKAVPKTPVGTTMAKAGALGVVAAVGTDALTRRAKDLGYKAGKAIRGAVESYRDKSTEKRLAKTFSKLKSK